MDGFTYHSLFETKGIEYIIIISFFAVLIPFWLILSRGKTKKTIRQALSLSARILRIPQGIYFNRNHTWMYLEKSGNAKVGLDELIAEMAGNFEINFLKKEGEPIQKGESIAEIKQGDKYIQVKSPLTGNIADVNRLISEDPEVLTTTPFEEGWFMEIEPAQWQAEAANCMIGKQAREWLQKELKKFREFVIDFPTTGAGRELQITLQDGGELGPQSLAQLPPEAWKRFEEKFM